MNFTSMGKSGAVVRCLRRYERLLSSHPRLRIRNKAFPGVVVPSPRSVDRRSTPFFRVHFSQMNEGLAKLIAYDLRVFDREVRMRGLESDLL